MLVDRTRFLTFAMTIAATTVACASETPDDVEAGDEAALTQAGGQCKGTSIKTPGAGSKKPFAYEEGYCFDLARFEQAPDAEGITTGFFDFIQDQCRAYSAQLQPAVAKAVQGCLDQANAERKKTSPLPEFDAMKMYDCGHEALWNICSEGIDKRVNQGGRCDRIAAALKSKGDTRVPEAIVAECSAVLSGLKAPARAQVEACVLKDPFDLWTCIEGMSIDFTNRETGEPAPSGAEACSAPKAVAAPPDSACAAIVADITAAHEANRAFAVPEFAAKKCETYLKKFEPSAAAGAIACLEKSAETKKYQNIYTCGTVGLRKVCQDPSVDATCKGIVDAVTKLDDKANAGGRLTRQCRSLFPGLTAAARTEVATCTPKRAADFKASKIEPHRALYSCIESL